MTVYKKKRREKAVHEEDLFEQILTQRAAYAAVLHLDHALLHTHGPGACSLHKRGVDVDLRHNTVTMQSSERAALHGSPRPCR